MIIVPVMVLTFTVAAKIYTDRSTTYWATGTELLVSGRGQASAAEQVENASLSLDLLEDLWRQPSVLRQLAADGLSDDFEVRLSEAGTTLQLEVIGTSPEQAVATAERLVSIAPDLLGESLGEQAVQGLVVDQAVAGTAEDAQPVGDGTYRYSPVVVVSTTPRSTLNPFPASLATVRSLVTIADSIPFQAAVARAFPGATYEVTGNVREAPLLSITAWTPTGEAAVAAHRFVVDTLKQALDGLQSEAVVDPDARTQMQTLVPASFAVPTPTSKVRPVAAVVVLGSGLAIGLATLVEALAADRRRRRAERDDVSPPVADGLREPRPVTLAEAETGDDDSDESPNAPAVISVGRRSRARLP